MSNPLNEAELDYLDNLLLDLGNDDSILGISELDGFLTAIVSGPEAIMPSRWYPILWGGEGKEPEWKNEAQMQRFMALLMQHMNYNITVLMDYPKEFEALFNINASSDKEILIVEEWCFGYMRGVALGNWPVLPNAMQAQLDAIELHGNEKYFSTLESFSLKEHQQSALAIEPAARALHGYFLQQRSAGDEVTGEFNKTIPIKSAIKVGRNDTCPCGSGKKFKQCCLH